MERNLTRRRSAATVGLATISIVLAACGGAYTKRDFVARADAICTSAVRQARSIPPPAFSGTSTQAPNGLNAYIAKLLPVVRTEIAQLRNLPRPAQGARGRATLDRWFGALAADLHSYRTLAAAARQVDAEGVASAEAALRASPAPSLAARYGLNACATPEATVA
jgi:hypothetical protein